MPKFSSFLYKLISIFAVLLILFFLFRSLFLNWQAISQYHFSFNYFYLVLSFLVLISSMASFGLVWRKILKKIEPLILFGKQQALKLYFTAEMTKYLPGNFWPIAGKTYLGVKQGLPASSLLVSSFFDSFLSLLAALAAGLFFLLVFWSQVNPYFYLLALLTVVFGLAVVHPKVFYPVANFILLKLKRSSTSQGRFLSYKFILLTFLRYFCIAVGYGFAFFIFIKSVDNSVHWASLPFFIGAYNLALGLGIAAVFAPSGIGVREGVLAGLLAGQVTLGIAVLLSFLARLWMSLAEIIVFGLVFCYSKLKFKKISL